MIDTRSFSLAFFFFFDLFYFIFYFILFLAVLGLHCCARAPSSRGERGPLPAAVCRPLTTVASPIVEHGLQGARASAAVARGPSSRGSRALEHRLSSCGAQAQPLRGTRDPPGPGPEPVSPTLADGPVTTAPPGKAFSLAFTISSNKTFK